MKDQIKSQKGQDISDLTEEQARAHIESLLWPDGQPVCRHCGSVNAYRMKGASGRPGLCRCRDCKKQFTVTVGTIFEDSHIPLRKWVRGFHLMSTSKKGISALQLMRNLGLGSYPTAWFVAHRIREAMKREPVASVLKGMVEVDETYVGGKPRPGSGKVAFRGRGTSKQPVVVLVERDGTAVSYPIQFVTGKTLKGAIRENVDKSSTIVTDDFGSYHGIGKEFDGGHHVVKHSQGEYARGDTTHTIIPQGRGTYIKAASRASRSKPTVTCSSSAAMSNAMRCGRISSSGRRIGGGEAYGDAATAAKRPC